MIVASQRGTCWHLKKCPNCDGCGIVNNGKSGPYYEESDCHECCGKGHTGEERDDDEYIALKREDEIGI